jgi:hypothetical protein
MGAFCRLLFDIQGIESSEVANAIQHHLGCQARSGQVGLNWELLTVLAITDSPVTAR